ncbi:cilia- and flagella-associated protein 61-like [Cimex lectularius]|uniref:CFAP61 dimerisation domain-containing protein n=1 Tax=Cimex lectularius TaxID=79782 RepID=A0A8I6RNF1_CIMLE|nr:cilia- and flagella-associated protein 61-like [Cimex lectularius]
MVNNLVYQREILRALIENQDELKCYVLLVYGIIIGFAIVCPEKNPDYLKFHFDLEKYMKFKLHCIPNHGYVKHFMVSKLFQRYTRFFLRGIMHMSGFTSLYHTVYPTHIASKFEDFTPLSGIKFWMPVRPRLVPIYSPSLRQNQPAFLMANDYPPFALYYTNYRLSSLNRSFNDSHIVVVGASETGLSFIENLIFQQNTPYVAAVNITLVTMHRFPRKYKYQQIIETMMPKNGKYNLKYISKLGLENLIRIVDGTVTAVDRDMKQLVIDNNYFLMYDFLFLFCGTQFGNPELEKVQDFERRCTVPYDMKLTLRTLDRENPENLFTLNSPHDAFLSLEYIKSLDPTPVGKIIVYGSHIGALSCIEGLLTFGVPGNRIVYVETKSLRPHAIDQFNDPTVYKEISMILKILRITVYKKYTFSSFDLNKDTGKIEKVYFESQNNISSLECLVMFSFSDKQVNIKTVLALIKAHLVYDGKLVIDENFNTNDPYIFAAGPMTKYSRSYYAPCFNHEWYNSTEVGAELASRVPEIIKMPGYARLSPSGLIRFKMPNVTHCMLPGTRYCLLVRSPGPLMPIQTLLSTQKNFSKILLTGQIENPEQIGYFRIIMDSFNCVRDMVCVSSIPIDARNLINVYGMHDMMLNNIVARYYSQLIQDFYEYFKQPWAYVLYHDRFPQLLDDISKQYLKKLPHSKWTFVELVAYAVKLNKWKKIPEKSGLLLEDIFNYVPILKERIKAIFLKFLEDNSDQLPMFVTDSYLQALFASTQSDIIFDFQNVLRGVKPFVQPRIEVAEPAHVQYETMYYEKIN